jgi:DNA-binding LacI/PurR family transcriptional regulator
VPHDLSIVGLDDIDAASATTPALTTLRRPQREYGAAAMRMLIERIAGLGPDHPRRILYPCQLVVRGTTGPPANAGDGPPADGRRSEPKNREGR